MNYSDSKEFRIERLRANGYNPIHLLGNWYLIRKWSTNYFRWYSKIPIYEFFRLK